MVRLLLKLGAEPELQGTSDQARGYRSTGALGMAARHGSGTIVNLLLEAGAGFNLTNGYSALNLRSKKQQQRGRLK